MKTIKIIDLLNKIANDEEVPKKIKYFGLVYEYCNRCKQYEHNDVGVNIKLFEEIVNLTDTVEILEEEKKLPEKLNILTFSDLIDMPKEDLVDVIKEQRFKINEILDYLEAKGE